MFKRILSTSLLVVCVPGLLMAQDAAVKIQPLFKAGEATTKAEVKVKQILTLNGMDIPTETENYVTLHSTTERDGNNVTVTQKVKSLQANMQVAGQTINFDSANPDAQQLPGPLSMITDSLKAASKTHRTYKIDAAKAKVTECKIPQDVLDSVPENARDQFSPENFIQEYQNGLDIYPKNAVKKGDTWTITTVANLGSGQTMSLETEITYHGAVKKDGRELHRLTSEVKEVEFEMDSSKSPIPLALKDSDLSVKKSEGEMHYDAKRGEFVMTRSTVQIVGKLVLEIQGMELAGNLDLTLANKTMTE